VLHHLLSPGYLIDKVGLFGLFAIVFAETGLLIGFFLPGDSLLVTAGVLSSHGKHSVNVHFNIVAVVLGCLIAAIAGAEVGYLIGRTTGPTLFSRPRSRLFKPDNVTRAQGYFEHYGNRTIVMARFIPVVRTFANPVAGVSGMTARAFTIYNVAGGLAWVLIATLGGYYIGNSVRDIYLIPGVIILSFIPIVVEVLRNRRHAN